MAAITPTIKGILEGAVRGFQENREYSDYYRDAILRKDLKEEKGRWGERLFWVGELPIWVHAKTNTAWLAPSGVLLIGSAEKARERIFADGKLPWPRGQKWGVVMRVKNKKTAFTDLTEKVASLGGFVPRRAPVADKGTRKDELLYEVWLPLGKDLILRDWKRANKLVRATKRIENPWG